MAPRLLQIAQYSIRELEASRQDISWFLESIPSGRYRSMYETQLDLIERELKRRVDADSTD